MVKLKKLIGILLLSTTISQAGVSICFAQDNINVSSQAKEQQIAKNIDKLSNDFYSTNPTEQQVIDFKTNKLGMKLVSEVGIRTYFSDKEKTKVKTRKLIKSAGNTEMFKGVLDKLGVENINSNPALNASELATNENNNGYQDMYIEAYDYGTDHDINVYTRCSWDGGELPNSISALSPDVLQMNWDSSRLTLTNYSQWGKTPDLDDDTPSVQGSNLGAIIWKVDDCAENSSYDIYLTPVNKSSYGDKVQFTANYTHTYGAPGGMSIAFSAATKEFGVSFTPGVFQWGNTAITSYTIRK